MRWIRALIPPFALPAEVEIRMDMGVLTFALAVTIVTGLLFGLAPAVQAARTNLTEPMKEGGPGTTPTNAGKRVRSTLVVAEVALAFVLLVGSGLLLRSLFGVLAVDPGFDSENVLTANLPIANVRHPDPVELNQYLRSIRTAVEAVPGVRETALTSALPLQGWGYGMPYQVASREIGIRAALGASAGSLRGLVFRGGMRLTLIGLAIGLAGSLALGSFLTSMLYGVGGRDPLTIAAVAALLAAVAAGACFVPARRATKVDPIVALRYQ